jgi:hypothetical protein
MDEPTHVQAAEDADGRQRNEGPADGGDVRALILGCPHIVLRGAWLRTRRRVA